MVAAQEPIIEETTPPTPQPKPKPRGPSFVKPRLLWHTQLGRMESTPVVQGDELFVVANGNLIALDTEGHIQWTSDIGPVQTVPAIADKAVYVGTTRGVFYALDRQSGTPLWKFVTDGNATLLTPPILSGDRLCFESTDNNLYALSYHNGQLRWKFNRPDGSLGYSGPAVEGDTIYIAGETTLYSLDPTSGKQNWKAYIGGKSQSIPLADTERVYVGGDGTGLNAFSRKDGSLAWMFRGKSEGDWFGTPLLASGTIYVSTYRRFVYALDAATGRFKWSGSVMGTALCQPAIDTKRGVLYVTSTTLGDSPSVTAFNSHTGRKLWDYNLGYIGGSPVVVGDRLYVASTNGSLYAFGLK
jgi:outer membrane protein assembly factor BamB